MSKKIVKLQLESFLAPKKEIRKSNKAIKKQLKKLEESKRKEQTLKYLKNTIKTEKNKKALIDKVIYCVLSN